MNRNTDTGAADEYPGTVTGVADEYLGALADLDPTAAQALGRADVMLIPDLSPDAHDQRADVARRAVRHLEQAAPATSAEHVLRAAMIERLTSDVALHDVGFTTALLAPLATPVHRMREVFDDLPRQTAHDWRRVVAHLELVPVALDEYAATLRASAGRGHVVAGRQVQAVAQQCETWVSQGFYPGLAAAAAGAAASAGAGLDTGTGADAGAGAGTGPSSGLDPALLGDLDRAAAEASTATSSFARFLREELLPIAGTTDGVGAEIYQVTSAAFLGAQIDLRETYEYGWEELAALTAQLREVAAQIAPGGVDAAIEVLDNDPAGQISGTDALARWLQRRLDETTDAVASVHFDIPERTRQVECRITAAAAGVMYYTPPDPGLTRPGRVTWTVPDGVSESQTWRDVSTLHHEGVPGHHLQHAITMALPGLHPWQRSLAHVHGYAEGWAHYAEALADEIGLIQTPGERLGMLLAQIWRAARIVIDAGLHLDLPIPAGNGLVTAERWTPEVGRDVLHQLAGVHPETAKFEVDRYLGWPGQALAFRVGARLWREARADAQRRAGASFDLKRFHMDALELGPMGLDPLRDILAARIPPP